MSDHLQHWMKILAAAARLAGLYAAGVVLLFVPFALFGGVSSNLTEALLGPALVAVIGFLIGFALLAVTRRLGFAVLWLLLLVIWLNMIRNSPLPLGLLLRFVGWTALAAPLYGLTAIGIGGDSSRKSLGREVPITALLWISLLVLALKFWHLSSDVAYPGAPYGIARVVGYLCMAMPFLLSLRELFRIGRALRNGHQVRAAA